MDLSLLNNLNQQQKQAVTHDKGPLLIVAGAGTGKTTVITKRIAYLIEQEKAKPEEILAVTFTDKAAGEMEERVDRLLPYGYIDLWISTFHSFCERVLRDHALDIGLPTDFKLIDPTTAWTLISQNLEKFSLNYYRPLGNQTKFIHALINHFSRCKDQGVYPQDYLKYVDSLKTNLTDLKESQETERLKEVAGAYHVYQRLLLENSSLDFGDLINYCLKLFQDRPIVLDKFRKKFKYILVDEFQDTNWAQYELVKLLSLPDNNLTVCADDDQAIYRWRGASFNNIIQFKKSFPKTKEVFLIENYRSVQSILDLSYKFIKTNDPNRLEYVSKINKKLKATKTGEGIIEHLHFKDLYEEAGGVINKIAEISKDNKETSFSDFAILVRANNYANTFTRALERANFPYQFLASRGLYSKPIILDIISYFKLLDNYHENSALYRILNFPFFNISVQDIAKINQYARRKTKSLYEALNELQLIFGISPSAGQAMNLVLSLIQKHTETAKNKNVSEVLISFLKDSGYLKYLSNKESRQELDLVNQFYQKIKNFEEANIDASLKNFMESLNMELESGEEGKLNFDPEQGPDMVRVMTIHSAKGLEFKYVFLVNLVDRRFPTSERKEPIEMPENLVKEIIPEGDIHLEEERRLCYVAMTRAKEKLFLTSADNYGGIRKKKPSRFLMEMEFVKKGDELAVKAVNTVAARKQKKKIIAPLNLPSHLSFSQFAAFGKCPLQYKFAHVLKIPIQGRAVFSFGKTMHNTLYDFVKLIDRRKNTVQSNLFASDKQAKQETEKKGLNLPDLVELYKKNWIDDWYESKNQKQEYYKLGQKIVKAFYEKFIQEQPKVFKINGDPALEVPFKFKIAGNTLKGKIDRIDEIKEGIEIIDYKTGRYKEKLSSEDKQQLLIYQMAAEQSLGLKPVKLSYYYLEEGKKTSFLGSDQEKEKQKQEIVAMAEKIKNSSFNAIPGWQCKYCDFRDICNYAQK
ncbi:MAG: UvrD-helicase domain-containing protein [Patescibacteria group bacterium]|nr:UvrD-helicase domain-containing protein [Patescibacteria group bacterium]